MHVSMSRCKRWARQCHMPQACVLQQVCLPQQAYQLEVIMGF